MSNKLQDPVIHIRSVVSRMDNVMTTLRRYKANLPRWAFVRRARIDGALAALQVESEALLELAAKCQPIIGVKVRG